MATIHAGNMKILRRITALNAINEVKTWEENLVSFNSSPEGGELHLVDLMSLEKKRKPSWYDDKSKRLDFLQKVVQKSGLTMPVAKEKIQNPHIQLLIFAIAQRVESYRLSSTYQIYTCAKYLSEITIANRT